VILATNRLESYTPCTVQQNTRSQPWQRDSDGNWSTSSPKSVSLWVQYWKDIYPKFKFINLRIHELFVYDLEWSHLDAWAHSIRQIMKEYIESFVRLRDRFFVFNRVEDILSISQSWKQFQIFVNVSHCVRKARTYRKSRRSVMSLRNRYFYVCSVRRKCEQLIKPYLKEYTVTAVKAL
jgi:hypothetical protein